MRSEHQSLIIDQDLHCRRCNGVLVRETLFDPEETLPNRIFCARCLNCGGIFFPSDEHGER